MMTIEYLFKLVLALPCFRYGLLSFQPSRVKSCFPPWVIDQHLSTLRFLVLPSSKQLSKHEHKSDPLLCLLGELDRRFYHIVLVYMNTWLLSDHLSVFWWTFKCTRDSLCIRRWLLDTRNLCGKSSVALPFSCGTSHTPSLLLDNQTSSDCLNCACKRPSDSTCKFLVSNYIVALYAPWYLSLWSILRSPDLNNGQVQTGSFFHGSRGLHKGIYLSNRFFHFYTWSWINYPFSA